MIRFTEITTRGPERNGTPGGDSQLTESWVRAFEGTITEGESAGQVAVVDVDFYTRQNDPKTTKGPCPVQLVRQTEYSTYTAPRRDGDEPTYSNATFYTYTDADLAALGVPSDVGLPSDEDLIDSSAFQAAMQFDPAMLTWVVDEFNQVLGNRHARQ